MGGTLNHPTPQNMSEWMRLIERRVLTQERREPQFGILQRLGPGLSKYAHQVVDWNTENTWLAGQFWSSAESLHSPDATKEWIGFTKVAADHGGVQEIVSMDGSVRKQRPFTFNNPDGLPTFGEWTDIGSGSTGGPPTGAAGGDLTGFYPNPEIAAEVVGTAELAPNAVTTSRIADGTILATDLAPGVIPTTLPPSGPAGGDLTGTYPNPQLAPNSVGSAEIIDGSIGSAEIADGSIQAGDLAPGVLNPGGLVLTFASLTTWIGVHNLNQRPVDVTLMNAAGEKFFATVSYPDVNTVQAVFGVAVAGSMLVQK